MRTVLLLSAVLVSAAASGLAEEDGWPRAVLAREVTIEVYQPQPEKLSGDRLAWRAAVSVKKTPESDPVFGVVWMEGVFETDRDTRTARILSVKVTAVRFPGSVAEEEQKLKALLEKEIPAWHFPISLDRLTASLETAEKAQHAAEKLNLEPPDILFVEHPAVLVSLDGEPVVRKVDGSDVTRVVNTPFLLVFDPGTEKHYLDGGSRWYVSDRIEGDWKPTTEVPEKVLAVKPKPTEEEKKARAEAEKPESDALPKIIVVKKPTELISSDGKPGWKPIEGADLLYVSNTNSDVFMTIGSQQYFILISGRWYRAAKTKGPWNNVPSSELPASFSKIPPESEKGEVLTFVADTGPAKDAVLDSYVPQTATVTRDTKIEVKYDGEPKFDSIEGTSMTHAVNTSEQVIAVQGVYYCCHQGVWFVAKGAKGPWVVADSVPQEIYTIPPSSPVYNVKYVYVYDSTPEVVYVGYTPGYAGSYVYNGTIVYGTGWYYRPWIGTYYYPRPATWGFHVGWNPWSGWHMGFSFSTGAFTIGIGFGGLHGGWWGPVGWHHGFRHGWHHGFRHGFYHGWHHGVRAGYRAGRRASHRSNMYRSGANRSRMGSHNRAGKTRPAKQSPRGKNNVFGGKDGHTYRNQGNKWEKRSGGGWSSSGIDHKRSGNLNRDRGARQRGSSRTSISRGVRRR